MGKVLAVKIQQNKELIYKNKVNFDDFKQVAIILSDLETYGGKVEKAIKEFRKRKRNKEDFPW